MSFFFFIDFDYNSMLPVYMPYVLASKLFFNFISIYIVYQYKYSNNTCTIYNCIYSHTYSQKTWLQYFPHTVCLESKNLNICFWVFGIWYTFYNFCKFGVYIEVCSGKMRDILWKFFSPPQFVDDLEFIDSFYFIDSFH